MRRTLQHLQHLCTNQRGIVLAMTLILMALLAAMASGYAMMVRTDTVLRGGASRARQGFYTAEGGLNAGMAKFANIFRNFGVPQGDDFEEQSVWVGNRLAYYDLDEVAGYAPCTEEQPECYTTIPAGEKFAGLNSIPYRYTVKAYSQNSEGDTEAELGAEFDIHNIPIFQFLAFSVDDLYIMPAPNMDLHGRIHANDNLYLNVNSGKTLTVGDDQPDMSFVQVSAGKQIYRGGYKSYTGNICTGTIKIDKLEDVVAPFSDLDPQTLSCSGSGPTPVPQATQDSFLGSLEDGVETISLPSLEDLGQGGIFWQRADLRIVLNLNQPPAAIDFGAANLCPNGAQSAIGPTVGTRSSQALFPIEVQDSTGAVDAARTQQLWRFMCERRGAVFYTDLPVNPPTPPGNNTQFSNTNANYAPTFPTVPGGSNDKDTVYRRVGEDTSGDGVVDNWDYNPDICPVTSNAADPVPWWRPVYCDNVYGAWPNTNTNVIWGANPILAASWYNDYDYRRGGFFNHREGQWMMLLNVNMRALLDWNEVNGGPFFASNDNSDWGLVIYLTIQGPNSNVQNNYGVRIFDSADLNTQGGTFPFPAPQDPTGLTVVSDQAVIVQGNYNSDDKYPAAVMGDAVSVLSQGWEVPLTGSSSDPRDNDRKSAANLSTNRRDVPSTDGYWQNDYDGTHTLVCASNGCANFSNTDKLVINAAFITGIGSEGAGVYNGGLENFPRFHESWSYRRLNYLGSFVSLGPPAFKQNAWPCGSGNSCNVYDPPERWWDYDFAFNQVEWLPPLTPMFTYVQQRMYTRFYD